MSTSAVARSRKKRVAVPAAITALSVGAVGVLVSGAVFTSSKTVEKNAFSAGTVDINAAPASTVFKAANMAPGDVVVAPLTVSNDGSLALRYAMTSTATGALAPALRLQVKTGVTTCTADGFGASGIILYGSGSIGDATGTYKVIGDSKTGPDAGDRTLASGASEDLCLAVSLPGAATGNEYQAKDANVTFVFNAEQTKNNDILPPTSTDSSAQANGNLVTWDPSPSPVSGYRIRRSADGGKTWTDIATVDNKTFSYLDTTAIGGETYAYTVLSVSAGGTTAGTTKPPAPVETALVPATNVTADATGSDDAADIHWTGSTSMGVTGYTVQRSQDNGETWDTLGTTGTEVTSFTDDTTTAGTAYVYRIVTNGQSKTANSEASSPVIAGTLPPTNVTAADQDNGNLVSWTPTTSPNATGYKVLRSTDGGTTWATLASVGTSARSYLDASAEGGETYSYTVVSIAPGGTPSDHATPTGAVSSVLLAPTQVSVAPTATDDGVTIAWNPSGSNGVTGYTVQRSTDGGTTWSSMGTVGPATASYADKTTTAGTSYVYRVVTNGKTKTAASTASTSVIAGTLPPATMNAVAQNSGNVITWGVSPTSNTTGYKVLRSADGGTTWSTLASVGASTLSYTDTTALGGETYSYAVVSVAPGGTPSVRSQAVAVTTVLLPPTGLTAAVNASADGVNIGWTASVSNGITGYAIQRSADGGTTWTDLGTVSASARTYTDTTIVGGVSYTYRVVANGTSKTATSATSAAVVAARPVSTPAASASDTSVWTAYNSTASQWTMNNGQATTTAAASSNPILAADSKNQNVSTTLAPASTGSAIYSRVTDGNNWLRARVNQTQSTQTCSGCGSEPTGYFSKSVPTSTQVFDHYSVLTQTRTATTMYSGTWTRTFTACDHYTSSGTCVTKAGVYCSQTAATSGTWGPQTTNLGGTSDPGDAGCNTVHYTLKSTSISYGAWSAGSTSNSSSCPSSTTTVNYTCTAVYRTDTTYTTQTCTEWYYSSSVCENGGYTFNSSGSPYRYYDTTTTVYTYYLMTDKAVAGQVTQLANYSLGSSLPAYIRLVTNGDSIKSYYGPNTSSMTLASTVTDSFNQTATRNGVGLAASTYGTPSGVGTVTFANAS